MDYKDTKRYSVPTDEDFEPGSNNEVLKNKLGVKSKEIMEQLETRELDRVEMAMMDMFDQDHQFKINDICQLHKVWLSDIYQFAGKFRSVAMSKEGFPFAAPGRVNQLMLQFEKNYLTQYTPCHFTDINELANALGVVHVELIVIHPFREGNGRTARLLADLMAMQAQRPPLNYKSISQIRNKSGFNRYIQAIHAGFAGDYGPIQEAFTKLLEQ